MYIADLHIHSRFFPGHQPRRGSPPPGLVGAAQGHWAGGHRRFHPPRLARRAAGTAGSGRRGTYTLREDLRLPQEAPGPAPYFVVTGEISCIYKRHGKTRKVHNLLLLPSLEAAVFQLFEGKGLTLGCAESCTGGLIAKRMTDLSGVSAVFRGGVVSYATGGEAQPSWGCLRRCWTSSGR